MSKDRYRVLVAPKKSEVKLINNTEKRIRLRYWIWDSWLSNHTDLQFNFFKKL